MKAWTIACYFNILLNVYAKVVVNKWEQGADILNRESSQELKSSCQRISDTIGRKNGIVYFNN